MGPFYEKERGLALLRDLSACLSQLTRIPVPGSTALGTTAATRSVWAFPIIGAVLGAIGGGVYTIGALAGLTPALAALAGIGCLIAVTGARNEKLLVQAADRFGLSETIVLMLLLGARVGTLAAIAQPTAVAASLVAALSLSLAAGVAVRHYAADAWYDDPGGETNRPSSGIVLAAALIAIVMSALVLPFGAGAAIIAACLCGAGLAYAVRREVTGDATVLADAVQPVTEIAVLVVLAASAV